ncbi:MAG: PKD domain-containing protein, partial [Haliscomenobacteraceae bacterium CHB4]|nr:PKD domain-containing protein [Haliscomenobacteraceae bacterium CHB4]
MKPNFFLAALFTTFWPVLISAQDWQYAKRYSAATGSILTNAAVSTAPDGSTYLVGTVRGTVMFDNISVSTPTGITQSYLLKLDMGAQAVWVQTFDQKAYDVTTDAQGNVFVAGAIAVGSPASDSLTFIAKYDANGQLLASLESSGAGKSWAKAVRTDAAGNCYATGWKTGTVSFGAFTLPDQGNRDNFLVKLSPDLALVNWAVNTGSSNKLDEVYDLELDDNGGIYTAGNYSQTFQLIPCFCYNGSFFTEKRSTSNGALFWQKIYSGGSGTSTQQVLALAGDGQTLYTASSFKNTVQIPPNITLTAQSGTDDYQLFAAGLNSTDGNVQWAKKISFTGDSYITGMAWAEDTLHLHGYFKSNTLMGNVLLEPLGTFDAFYTEVAPANGNVTNAEKFTGNGTDQGLGIVSGDGRLAVSGNTSSNSLTIGNFNLPGSTNSIYVAGKIFDIPLNISISNITDASCPGIADGSATVAVQGGVSPYTYLWNNGQTDATATGLAAGSYTVTVTDGAGTQISATATITEPPALTAGFANSVNGLSVSFSNNSSNAASYLWNFGDGQTSTEANPAHTYANCGAYSVTLTASNLCGTATSTANITIGNGLPVTGFANSVNGLSV